MEELLLFHVGTMQYGVDLSLVKSIQSAKPIVVDQKRGKNPLPRQVDGKTTLLYDLLSIFGKKISSRYFENEKLILVETESQPIGLIVSRVDQVVSADLNQIAPLSPVFKKSSLSCFSKVLKHENSLVLLLNPGGIVKVAQKVIELQIHTETPYNEITSNEIKNEHFCLGHGRKHIQESYLNQKAG
jgi:chemotaxis signal transduction protein